MRSGKGVYPGHIFFFIDQPADVLRQGLLFDEQDDRALPNAVVILNLLN